MCGHPINCAVMARGDRKGGSDLVRVTSELKGQYLSELIGSFAAGFDQF
jgi:hypothetical protein